MLTGELLSLLTAVFWTATALLAEVASRGMGSLPLNVWRMGLTLLLLSLTLLLTLGAPYPLLADAQTWLWLSLSGFVGYVLGDYCLYQSYVRMSARYGQLFLTLSAPSAALAALVLLGEHLSLLSLLGMVVTLTGIAISVLNRGREEGSRGLHLKLPLDGVLFGVGAGMGQGVGLVLSKIGLNAYRAAIERAGVADPAAWLNPEALFPVSLDLMMPFASTLIRAVIGFLCFPLALWLFARPQSGRLRVFLREPRVMLCTLGTVLFGPVIGVSLSLMATLYTQAGIAQTIMALTPVLIIAPSYLLYRNRVTLWEVIGALVSVAGAALFFI